MSHAARDRYKQHFDTLLARYRAGCDVAQPEADRLTEFYEAALLEHDEQPCGSDGGMSVFGSPAPRPPLDEALQQLGLTEPGGIEQGLTEMMIRRRDADWPTDPDTGLTQNQVMKHFGVGRSKMQRIEREMGRPEHHQ